MGHFKFVGIFFLVIIAIALSGCFNEDNPASCSYEVTISGLADYSSSDTTFILIPAPVMSGEPIFSDKDLQDLRLNGWNASIVNMNMEI